LEEKLEVFQGNKYSNRSFCQFNAWWTGACALQWLGSLWHWKVQVQSAERVYLSCNIWWSTMTMAML